jgi:hypothetical protein
MQVSFEKVSKIWDGIPRSGRSSFLQSLLRGVGITGLKIKKSRFVDLPEDFQIFLATEAYFEKSIVLKPCGASNPCRIEKQGFFLRCGSHKPIIKRVLVSVRS